MPSSHQVGLGLGCSALTGRAPETSKTASARVAAGLGKARSLRTILKLRLWLWWGPEPATVKSHQRIVTTAKKIGEEAKQNCQEGDIITSCRQRFLSLFGRFPAECRQAHLQLGAHRPLACQSPFPPFALIGKPNLGRSVDLESDTKTLSEFIVVYL